MHTYILIVMYTFYVYLNIHNFKQHVQGKRPIIRPSAPSPPLTVWADLEAEVVFHNLSVSLHSFCFSGMVF